MNLENNDKSQYSLNIEIKLINLQTIVYTSILHLVNKYKYIIFFLGLLFVVN